MTCWVQGSALKIPARYSHSQIVAQSLATLAVSSRSYRDAILQRHTSDPCAVFIVFDYGRTGRQSHNREAYEEQCHLLLDLRICRNCSHSVAL